MVRRRFVASAAVLLGGAALLSAGCASRPTVPVGGWYAPPPPPLSCASNEEDAPCVVCAKASCCEETRACDVDSRCRCLLRCVNRPWPFSECIAEGTRCGPVNDLYRAERTCLSARCAMCPAEHE